MGVITPCGHVENHVGKGKIKGIFFGHMVVRVLLSTVLRGADQRVPSGNRPKAQSPTWSRDFGDMNICSLFGKQWCYVLVSALPT